jgi:hypothetical protein
MKHYQRLFTEHYQVTDEMVDKVIKMLELDIIPHPSLEKKARKIVYKYLDHGLNYETDQNYSLNYKDLYVRFLNPWEGLYVALEDAGVLMSSPDDAKRRAVNDPLQKAVDYVYKAAKSKMSPAQATALEEAVFALVSVYMAKKSFDAQDQAKLQKFMSTIR